MLGHGVGPIPSRIMIVGEAWGETEESQREPFVGASGQELNRMAHEAGILRSEAYVTNVVNARPPGNDIGAWIALKKKDIGSQHVPLRDKYVLPLVAQGFAQLKTEIAAVQPQVIVAFGNLAMWALTGAWGITKWRGSNLQADLECGIPGGNPDGTIRRPLVIPTIHPAAVLREWSQRAIVVNDLKRAARCMRGQAPVAPKRDFIIRPSFARVQEVFELLKTRLAAGQETWIDVDIETRAGHIACLGLSWSKLAAICIPLMCVENKEGYWTLEEEAWIIWQCQQILTHPLVRVRWQNGLYDAQYIHRHWHFIPRGAQDTMISQHAVFSDLPKSLAFIASMYADHYVYWKDEGKTWSKNTGEEQLWSYNCLDCVYTREAGEALQQTSANLQLESVHSFQQAMFYPVLKAMLRGVRVLKENRDKLSFEIQEQIDIRQNFLRTVLDHEININSPKQMQALFYNDLGQRPIMTRPKKGKPGHVTCDDEALLTIAKREPLLKPLVSAIADIRTLRIFLGNFVLARLDTDERMRCSYNIGGSESGKSAPKTYRLSSSTNAFGGGTNLQNIPSEKSKSVGKSAARGHIAMLGDPYALPNVRSLFGPDPGYTFFDMDLDRADLQVVVWEADDAMLKAALRQGADIHLLNAYVLEGKEPPPLEELVEGHPRYADHRGPLKLKREFSKVFCHATNYLGGARTVAAAVGRTIHETERAQAIWFGAHPGIKRWHNRVIEQATKRRYVENRFGYRWYIFDRIESALAEAVAWVPQSTVSIVINRIWMNLFQNSKEWNFDLEHMMKLMARSPSGIEVLMQVHDSLAGQFPSHMQAASVARLKELGSVTVPYDDPLVIPVGIATSEVSWGNCVG